MLDVTKDIQSLTTFRRRSGDFMKQLRTTRRPVVLTVKGKAAALVHEAEAWQRLLDMGAYADPEEASIRVWRMQNKARCGQRESFSRTLKPRAAYLVSLTARAERDLALLVSSHKRRGFPRRL